MQNVVKQSLMGVKQFLKSWTLPVAICWGAIAYFFIQVAVYLISQGLLSQK